MFNIGGRQTGVVRKGVAPTAMGVRGITAEIFFCILGEYLCDNWSTERMGPFCSEAFLNQLSLKNSYIGYSLTLVGRH